MGIAGVAVAIVATFVAAGLALPATALAAHVTTVLGGIAVDLWTPDAGDDRPRPVIVFSHGFLGCATQSRFLTEGLAAAGYLVVAPNHRDASCRGGLERVLGRIRPMLVDPAAWTEGSFRDRADDIRRALDGLRTDDRFRARADLSRLGLAGHSLGGYTVLGLAGAWPGWRMPDVKAVLALSPYSQPFVAKGTLAGLRAPVMFQGGTLDPGISAELVRVDRSYEQSPEPKHLVEFEGAGHFAWTNMGVGHRSEIVAYAVAFMDRYVRGEPAAPALTHALPGVATLRHAP